MVDNKKTLKLSTGVVIFCNKALQILMFIFKRRNVLYRNIVIQFFSNRLCLF